MRTILVLTRSQTSYNRVEVRVGVVGLVWMVQVRVRGRVICYAYESHKDNNTIVCVCGHVCEMIDIFCGAA